jgi:hypothetical protein
MSAAAAANSFLAQSLEGLQEAGHLVRWDNRTCVAEGENGSSVSAGCRDLDPSARMVVTQRVVDQVGHEAAQKTGIANSGGFVEHRVDTEGLAGRVLLETGYEVLRESGEIDRFPNLDALLAGGERQQGVDEAFLVAAERKRFFACGPERLRIGVGVCERDLQQGSLPSEWCA